MMFLPERFKPKDRTRFHLVTGVEFPQKSNEQMTSTL